jgi:predicted nucleotidyltransferase
MDKHEQLTERNKELNCLYEIDKLLQQNPNDEDYLKKMLPIVEDAFQYISLTRVEITHENLVCKSAKFEKSANYISADIIVNQDKKGCIKVYYVNTDNSVMPVFLDEEKRLLFSIAARTSDFFTKLSLKQENYPIINNNKDQSIIRLEIVNIVSRLICKESLGIKDLYLIGSTKNRTAADNSDIDIIIHYNGNEESKIKIKNWFSDLTEMIVEKFSTIHKPDLSDIFDLHFITDDDLRNKTSYAVMIESKNNSALLIQNY